MGYMYEFVGNNNKNECLKQGEKDGNNQIFCAKQLDDRICFDTFSESCK